MLGDFKFDSNQIEYQNIIANNTFIDSWSYYNNTGKNIDDPNGYTNEMNTRTNFIFLSNDLNITESRVLMPMYKLSNYFPLYTIISLN